jgi:transposase
MSATPRFGGIAVAKAQRDMALRPTGARGAVAHADVGMAVLVARLQAVPPPLLVREATGGDQRAVVAALAAAGLPVAVVNPRHARDGATATGPWAQTEALDARALAPVAEAGRPTPRPLSDAQADARRALLARRRPLVARRTAAQNRLGSAPHGCSRTSRPRSPGATPGGQRWTTTATRRGGRVRCGGSARIGAAASLVWARSVPVHGGSTGRSWAR